MKIGPSDRRGTLIKGKADMHAKISPVAECGLHLSLKLKKIQKIQEAEINQIGSGVGCEIYF
jgi:hypothetical protein